MTDFNCDTFIKQLSNPEDNELDPHYSYVYEAITSHAQWLHLEDREYAYVELLGICESLRDTIDDLESELGRILAAPSPDTENCDDVLQA